MEHRKEPFAVMAAGLLALLLSGCGAFPPVGLASGTESETAAPVATGAAGESTPPAASDPPQATASCESVLTADAHAKFADTGAEPIEPPPVDHLATYYALAARMVEAGALICQWGKPNTDASVMVVQLSDADWAEWEQALADEGFVATGDPVPGAYSGEVDPGTGYGPVVVVTGDTLTFVNGPTLAGMIAPTS